VLYQISECYSPGHQAGLRYNDPALGIQWPLPVSDLSERDRNWPLIPNAPRILSSRKKYQPRWLPLEDGVPLHEEARHGARSSDVHTRLERLLTGA
jgi:hypothetical protein